MLAELENLDFVDLFDNDISDFSPVAGVSTVYRNPDTGTDTGSFTVGDTNQGIDQGAPGVTISDSSSGGGGDGGGSCFIGTAANTLGW